MNDPWTWTMVQGRTVGVGVNWTEEGMGENWDNCNRINKNKKITVTYLHTFGVSLLFNDRDGKIKAISEY